MEGDVNRKHADLHSWEWMEDNLANNKKPPIDGSDTGAYWYMPVKLDAGAKRSCEDQEVAESDISTAIQIILGFS
jgi:hypothetical protein